LLHLPPSEGGDGAGKESERRWQQGNPRALERITVALKDEMAVKGWSMTAGSKVFRDRVMSTNAPIVVKLLDAGCRCRASRADHRAGDVFPGGHQE
jgi:Asp-tRNA(Asn)/Glu-tRNA(Gln) amidotransferase A subunit family amidase